MLTLLVLEDPLGSSDLMTSSFYPLHKRPQLATGEVLVFLALQLPSPGPAWLVAILSDRSIQEFVLK